MTSSARIDSVAFRSGEWCDLGEDEIGMLASSGRPSDMSRGALNMHNGRHVDGIRVIAMDCERWPSWRRSCKP